MPGKKNSASSSLYGQSHLGNFLLLLIILYHWVSTLKTILDLVKPFAVLYLNTVKGAIKKVWSFS